MCALRPLHACILAICLKISIQYVEFKHKGRRAGVLFLKDGRQRKDLMAKSAILQPAVTAAGRSHRLSVSDAFDSTQFCQEERITRLRVMQCMMHCC